MKYLFILLMLTVYIVCQWQSIEIARIKSEERLEMARLKIVEKYFYEMDRQEKLLEVTKMLAIGKKKKGSK